MFDLQSLNLINRVAYELALQGRPERDALFLVTDPRRKAELEAVLQSAEKRGQCTSCAA
jgi:lipocalin